LYEQILLFRRNQLSKMASGEDYQTTSKSQPSQTGDDTGAGADEVEDKLRFYVNSEEAEISSH